MQGFRISPQQKNLWLLQESNPGLPYLVLGTVLLEGDLQPRILEKALYSLVQRHEILRTTFQRPAGVKVPFQVVSDDAHPSWQGFDLSNVDSAQQQQRINATLKDERSRGFDLERGPLFRVNVFKLSPHRRVMTIRLPVLGADLATLGNFVKELHTAYGAILNEQEYVSDVMQYADFAEWQNELRE